MSHLTQEQRCQIFVLKKSNFSYRAISKELKVHPSTVSREIQRNSGKRGYRYKQAHEKSVLRRQKIDKKKISLATWNLVVEKLALRWSPEQIAGRLKLQNIYISHESIYSYVWKDKNNGGCLWKFLRHHGKKYNKRLGKNKGRGIIPDRIPISQRPSEVALKKRFGDIEIDTMVGKNHKGALITMVDRCTKYTWIKQANKADSQTVADHIISTLKHYPIKTITSDNGKEFAKHGSIASSTKSNFYFATPYHSWERGLNEHHNGLIRQYFPKKTDLSIITQQDVDIVAFNLNNRPRKILNYYSPQEIIDRMLI